MNSTDPSCDAQVVCGLPATVLQSILRPVHRVQSGRLHAWKKQRWPQAPSKSVRDLAIESAKGSLVCLYAITREPGL